MNNTVLEFECIGMDGGSKFPIEYTGRGQDISPEFIIKNLLPNAKTLAVTLEDLSHPIKEFTHWVIWNIPATDRIKKNIPAGKAVPILGNARQGMERLLGKKRFAEILGKLVYKPQGKVTLVPESDKRQEIAAATAEADFKEE